MLKEKNLEILIKKFMEESQSILTPRERSVVCLHFGFDGGRFRPFEEVGQLFGITSKNATKVFNSAIQKVENNEHFINIRQILGYKMLFCNLTSLFVVPNEKTEQWVMKESEIPIRVKYIRQQ